MYADDLTLLSRMKKGLDRLLCCLNSYALKWRIELNINKTVIMVFGEEKIDLTLHQREYRYWVMLL